MLSSLKITVVDVSYVGDFVTADVLNRVVDHPSRLRACGGGGCRVASVREQPGLSLTPKFDFVMRCI